MGSDPSISTQHSANWARFTTDFAAQVVGHPVSYLFLVGVSGKSWANGSLKWRFVSAHCSRVCLLCPLLL